MRRPFTELAKVAGGADDPLAEVMLPNAIHHHSCRQGIGRAGDPARQLHPAAAVGDRRLVVAGEDARESARHQLAEPIIAATDMHRNIVESALRALRATPFLNAVGIGDGPKRLLQLVELLLP